MLIILLFFLIEINSLANDDFILDKSSQSIFKCLFLIRFIIFKNSMLGFKLVFISLVKLNGIPFSENGGYITKKQRNKFNFIKDNNSTFQEYFIK